MKHAKRILALALAMALVFALAVPAFAADGDPIKIPGISGTLTLPGKPGDLKPGAENSGTDDISKHTFAAYQIFTATYAANVVGSQEKTPGELVGIKWGKGIDQATFVAALQTSTAFGTPNPFAGIDVANDKADTAVHASALKVAEVISEWDYDAEMAREFAYVAEKYIKPANAIPVGGELAAGYYLIVDTTASGSNLRNLTTLAMSAVGTRFNPTVKVDVPELEKKVLEVDDSQPRTNTNRNEWGDFADYDINDVVPFVLTGTVPATGYEYYETYRYVFHDTLSGGLRFNDDVRVFVNGSEIAAGNYEVRQNGSSFTVTFEDLKKVLPSITADATVQVLYTATLTVDGIVYGGTGNTNTAYLEYSNDPNYRYEGNPGENPPPPPTGETPEDIVTVFTFKLDANKIDENDEPLEGAGFTLYKLFAAGAEIPAKVPDELPEDADKFVLAGDKGTYYPVATLGGENATLTTFEFKGLDDGDYMLRETTVPKGYNKAEDMYFSVTAKEELQSDGTAKVTSLEVSRVKNAEGEIYTRGDANKAEDDMFTINAAAGTGIMDTSIVNLRGVVLPGTGGIGTTIFYVVGGLLLVGAAVVLVARKRMGKAE